MNISADKFQEYLTENENIWDKIDEKEEFEIKILITRLRNNKRFHTLKLFENNRAALWCVICTILTYIVVLLQLKTIEIPLS